MIVADTNVLSEPLRPAPSPAVLAWLKDHRHDLAMTSVSVGELRFGVLRLPPGARRDGLTAAVEALIEGAGDRVLPYDAAAAREMGCSARAGKQWGEWSVWRTR